MKIRTIIIDDEEPARILVKGFLNNHTEFELIGEYADGFSGLKAINEQKPDLVFLDIQMPKLTGFELLELIESKPLIVFATAYDQYAIQAFEANAIDYLLKPFSRDRFAQAISKVVVKFNNQVNDQPVIKSLVQSFDEKPETLDRIAVKDGSKIFVIPTNEIIYIQAEGDYVMIHIKDARHLKEKTMKYFETHLDNKQFIRIHRSYIVNVNYISRLDHYDKENYSVLMKNSSVLKASNAGYKLLKQALNL